MSRAILSLVAVLIVFGFFFAGGVTAEAQMAVTTYYPPQPVVTYLPERRGLFGQRLVYRPAVSYTAPAAVTVPVAPVCATPVIAPTTTYFAPAAPVAPAVVSVPTTTYYAPAAPVTTYYAPAAPVVVAPAPVVAAPVVVHRPVVVWP